METPRELDPEHRHVAEGLSGKWGVQFDADYLTAQGQEYQRVAGLLMWQISNGQNATMKSDAAAQLPAVLDHLEVARDSLAAGERAARTLTRAQRLVVRTPDAAQEVPS